MLLEWDAEIPSFEETHAEALRARAFMAEAAAGRSMNQHVVDLVTLHERASATPDRASRPRPVRARGPGRRPARPEADDAPREQLWFARAMTTPESDGLVDERRPRYG